MANTPLSSASVGRIAINRQGHLTRLVGSYRFEGTFAGLRRDIAARYARAESDTEPALLACLLLILAVVALVQ